MATTKRCRAAEVEESESPLAKRQVASPPNSSPLPDDITDQSARCCALVNDIGIWDLWMSQHQLVVVQVSIELDLFEFIQSWRGPGNLRAVDIAKVLELDRRGVKAIVAVLSSLGHLQIDDKGSIKGLGGDAVNFFLKASPSFWGPMLCSTMGPQQERLIHALKKGAHTKRVTSTWSDASLGEKQAEAIIACMHSHSASIAPIVVHTMKDILGKANSMLDVAGGSGVFALEGARKHSNLRCTVAELPAVVNILEVPEELQGRTNLHAMDMFRDSWPHGYDVHLLSNVLHDWDDATCRTLLQKSFQSLEAGGYIVLSEALLSEPVDNRSRTVACLSLHMFIYTEGRQRTFREMKELVQDVGFADVHEIAVESTYFSLVVAEKRSRVEESAEWAD